MAFRTGPTISCVGQLPIELSPSRVIPLLHNRKRKGRAMGKGVRRLPSGSYYQTANETVYSVRVAVTFLIISQLRGPRK